MKRAYQIHAVIQAVRLLSALCLGFAAIDLASAQLATGWQKASLPDLEWQSVAVSADGSKIVAVPYSELIYLSTNSGASWSATDVGVAGGPGKTVAMSSDGRKIFVISVNFILVSTDGGATWDSRGDGIAYTAIACSTNGLKVVAVAKDAQIYTSTDAGTNWTPRASVETWGDVASSADGNRLVACVGGENGVPGPIYTSTDSGVTWTAHSPSKLWRSVASSADGRKLIAVEGGDFSSGIFIGTPFLSANGGTNWLPVASGAHWIAAASSADGTRLLSASRQYQGESAAGLMCVSTNTGVNWELAPLPLTSWRCVASSADGKRLAAVSEFPGSIYLYPPPPSTNVPALTMIGSGGSCSLTWPYPSTGYLLQQRTNLSLPAIWVNVSNTPAIVNQVTALTTNATRFYRLFKP